MFYQWCFAPSTFVLAPKAKIVNESRLMYLFVDIMSLIAEVIFSAEQSIFTLLERENRHWAAHGLVSWGYGVRVRPWMKLSTEHFLVGTATHFSTSLKQDLFSEALSWIQVSDVHFSTKSFISSQNNRAIKDVRLSTVAWLRFSQIEWVWPWTASATTTRGNLGHEYCQPSIVERYTCVLRWAAK